MLTTVTKAEPALSTWVALQQVFDIDAIDENQTLKQHLLLTAFLQ